MRKFLNWYKEKRKAYGAWSRVNKKRRALFVLVASPYFFCILLYAWGEVVWDIVDECYKYIRYGV